MKRTDLGQVVTIVANLGVIVGLLFVALEVRQTRDAVLGATYMARATSQEDWGKWVAESEYVVHAAQRWGESGFSELSQEDQIRLLPTVEAAFHRMDGIFYQYELGLLPEDYYQTTFGNLMQVWVPRWRDSGFLDRGWIVPRPSFQAEIDKYLNDPLLLE